MNCISPEDADLMAFSIVLSDDLQHAGYAVEEADGIAEIAGKVYEDHRKYYLNKIKGLEKRGGWTGGVSR